MANNYESLKTDGHYTLARRIFQKVRSVFVRGLTAVPVTSNDEILSIGFMEIVGNSVGPWMVFTKGDNINITEGGLSGEYIISSDQIEDSYDYDEYEALPASTKNLDKLFIVDNAPAPSFFRYESNTKTLIFENGYATYDEDTKTLTIGG